VTAFETLLDHLLFPESPRWHEGQLWFSDMYAGRVYRFDPSSGELTLVLELDDRPSGLGWLPDGRLLVVSMESRQLLRLEPGGAVLHADLAPFVTGHPNDMVVDAAGRAYVGNFGKGYAEGEAIEPTNLVIVEPDGTARRGPGDLLFPNGTVISPDGRNLVVAEGFAQRLTEFDIGRDGGLSRRRVFADLQGQIPDGIALDGDGAIWVALPLGQEFIRVERNGNVTDRISVAPAGAFACALGGENRQTLFMCTAVGTPEQIQHRQSLGGILAAKVSVPGAGLP
jgi:sugar lactone lactonase YvrE